MPADILTELGFTEEEARQLAESKGDYSQLKWFMKPDTKTRAGDTAYEPTLEDGSFDFSDEDANRWDIDAVKV